MGDRGWGIGDRGWKTNVTYSRWIDPGYADESLVS